MSSDTDVCTMFNCKHVRWRHTDGPSHGCTVTGCPCRFGVAFKTAAYEGPDILKPPMHPEGDTL